jgi:hypothetical protein
VGSTNRSLRFVFVGSAVALALLAFPATVRVQGGTPPVDDSLTHDWNQDVPAHFTIVDGQVMLERDARVEPAESNQIVMAGDRLRTTTGRTEILFPDGTKLSVDENTELDFLSDSLLRLRDGRVRLNIVRATDTLDYRIDAAPGHVEIRAAGDYRVGLGTDQRTKPEIDLTVFRGTADLVNDNGRTTVRAGRHAVTSVDLEPSEAYSFNSASQDEFGEWVENQRDAHVVSSSSESAQYLPPESQYYASTLDSYGSWGYQAPYGAVWYPTVAVGWSPYYQGRWAYSNHYHWTWVGIDHWAWPTYHYGTWGVGAAGWYWVPGYAYAPAWVSWGYAPGYVGWCPIGPGGHPVGGWGWNDPYHHGSAWTVVPSHAMGHNVWVTQNAVRPDAMPLNARAAFAPQQSGPAPSGSALPRRDMGSISSPTRPRDLATPRTNAASTTISVATPRGGGNQSAGAVSGFPATSRAMTSMPDANTRAPITNGAPGMSSAARAIPRDAVRDTSRDSGRDISQGGSGFPSARATTQFPDATRSVPRAEISNSNGDVRVDRGRTDGFPSSSPTRAVPRGLDGPTGAPGIYRGQPTPGSGSAVGRGGSDGYRSVPPGPQMPTVDRGRSIPRESGPPMSSPSQPAMAAPERRAPVVSAPPSSASPSAAPPSSRGGGAGGQGSAVSRGRGHGGR